MDMNNVVNTLPFLSNHVTQTEHGKRFILLSFVGPFILIQVIEIRGHFDMRKQRQHTLVRRLVREETLRYCSMYAIASITSSKPSNTSEMAEFAFP